MAGYDFEFYETGRISVTAGQKAFTGSGTAWKLRGCEGALVIVAGAAAVNFVSTLSTDAEGEFRTAWTGPTLSNAQYTMWLPSAVAATALANHQRLAEIIASIQMAQPESANLTALAGLSGDAETLVRFLANGSFDLVKSSDVGIQDPNGSLGKFAAVVLAANKLLSTNGDKHLIQSDITAAAIALLNLSGTAAADMMPYLNGANGAALTPLTAVARNLLDDTTIAAQRGTLSAGRPVFKAHLAANQLVYNGTTNLSFTASPLNVGNCWSGGLFTAPEAGMYFFSMGTTLGDGYAGQFIVQIFVNGSVYTEMVYPMNPQNVQQYYRAGTLSAALQLAAGGTVQFKLVLDAVQGNPMMQAFRNFATGFLI